MKLIVDDNIELEITSQKFAPQLFEIIDRNRKGFSEFLSWVEQIQSIDNITEYLKNSEQFNKEKKEISFIILFNKEAVGRIGIHHINLQNRLGAIGYWLDKAYEGKGIITKSCIKLINYGFQEANLNRIEIKACVTNYKSQAIPTRLNFKKEGILRQAELVNDEFIDLYIYSVLRQEWRIKAVND